MSPNGRLRSAGRVPLGLILVIFALGLLAGGVAMRRLRAPQSVSGQPVSVLTGGADSAAVTHATPDTARAAGPRAEPDLLASRRTAVVQAAERVGPAVVSISVTQIRYVRESPFGASQDPIERYFDRFFPGRVYGEEISSLGSGVILDPRGIVVTNEHVVRDAKAIKVSLPDGRTFDGTLVSADRTYDLAVLRIPADDLPSAPVGDSDDLLVGEWAIALGNPFGFLLNDYQPTVTAGVVSATNRDIKPEREGEAIHKSIIQTDAAINPDNNGGPLVNGLGQVIGVNTFIFSTSGGSLGIGFAIPINTVVKVVREILEYGRVRQVWIGIRVQEISPMVANYFRIRDRRGLLVWGIDEGSPSDRAGVKVGDIIREVNGTPVFRAVDAQQRIFGATIGDRIRLKLEHEGATRDVTIVLEEAQPK